jgi:hypothetical protein
LKCSEDAYLERIDVGTRLHSVNCDCFDPFSFFNSDLLHSFAHLDGYDELDGMVSVSVAQGDGVTEEFRLWKRKFCFGRRESCRFAEIKSWL